MTRPFFLIAEREFRTYVVTLSFWVALLIGPLAMLGALAVLAGGAMPTPVTVHADDARILASLSKALIAVSRIEGHAFRIVGAGAHDTATLTGHVQDGPVLQFSPSFPLSPSGRALVGVMLERDLAQEQIAAGRGQPPVTIAATTGVPQSQSGAWSRFTLVAILWLTLTGSLGMLLQAVVRERANRALEGLLAAATPFEIMAGKLLGVGAVSALILFAWLACAAGVSGLAPKAVSAVPNVFTSLDDWAVLLRAAIVYLLAFVFYGAVTFGVGAAARDVAAAQNLSRPMFALLLVAFFTSMASASGVHLSWLIYVPPFTPFVFLTSAPSEISPATAALALIIFLAATAVAIRLAIGRLTVSGVQAAR